MRKTKCFISFSFSKENERPTLGVGMRIITVLCFLPFSGFIFWFANIVVSIILNNIFVNINGFTIWIITTVVMVFLLYNSLLIVNSFINYQEYRKGKSKL